MWTSESGRAADASGRYVGPAAVGVAHTCYLLRGAPVTEECVAWLTGVCATCPIDCDDRTDLEPGDDQDPGDPGQHKGGAR